jgi:excisionase family DNA binding protein
VAKSTRARERMATISEVAEHLGISVQTLYNWRAQKIGPKNIKVGNKIRYRWADVDAWLDNRTTGDAA